MSRLNKSGDGTLVSTAEILEADDAWYRRNIAKIKVGQIWQDNDPRMQMMVPIRTVEIIEVGHSFAMCKNCETGKITRIKVSRFKPNSTGYCLIKDV